MKIIDTTYINVNVADARRLNYGHFFTEIPQLPVGEGIKHRLYLIKAIIPYDWQTVYAGRDTYTINGTPYTLTHGIPNIVDLIASMNFQQPDCAILFNRISNRIEYINTTGTTMTVSSTCPLLGLGGTTLTIPAGATAIAPNLVDMRPAPIIQLRCSLPTAMWEITNTGGTSEVRNTSVLAVLGMASTPLYAHLIWRGGFDALYVAQVGDDPNVQVEFEMLDTEDNPIIPQTPPIFVYAIESYRDDEYEILNTQKEVLKLQRYDILLRNQGLIKQDMEVPAEKQSAMKVA